MSDITKLVDRGVPPNMRTQTFTQATVSVGDIILVKASLGHAARSVVITAAAAMTVRFNNYRTIFPVRDHNAWNDPWGALTPNLALGVQVIDTTNGVVSIAANSTFALDKDIPVEDIKIISASGNFEILVA